MNLMGIWAIGMLKNVLNKQFGKLEICLLFSIARSEADAPLWVLCPFILKQTAYL